MSKSTVESAGRPLEIALPLQRGLKLPMAGHYVGRLVFPSPEDSRLIASPRAWLQQASEAFPPLTGNPVTEARKQQFLAEVMLHYSDAITLDAR